MPISDWSTTAANNNASPPNGWPEGMAPSNVNNCARQMMADIRTWYGAFRLGGSISPSAMGTTENDYAPTGFSAATVLRLTPNASNTVLTGLAGGSAGLIKVLINLGSGAITYRDESSSSSAANRFSLTSDLIHPQGYALVLWYDGTSSRWRQIGDATQ